MLTVWNAYYVLDTVEHFMYVASFDLHEDPGCQYDHEPHLAERKTETAL